MVCRLLFVGDIHLGRRPSGLPARIGDDPTSVRELAPTAAWERCVAAAIERRVDAVVLAGDVVDDLDDRFEAYGHLERGVTRLHEAGVRIFGVAGNHDVKVLPRLADQIAAFRLIGRDGKWESVDVEGRGGGRARLVGWSFPQEKVHQSPVPELRTAFDSEIATLGVLHCDLGASSSPYAPVTRAELERAPVTGWFLGHVHKPSIESGARPIGYLGALVGMDPGEPGAHGPWLVEVNGPRITTCLQIPLAPLRFESEEVAIDGIDGGGNDDVEKVLTPRIQEAFRRIAERAGADALAACRVVSCRLTIVGRTRQHRQVRALIASHALEQLERWFGPTCVAIERIVDQSEPAIDLAEHARTNDPPGLLAQDLLALADEASPPRDLLDAAVAAIGRAHAVGDFALLGCEPPAIAAVRTRLARVARALLEDVLAAKLAGGGSP